MAIEEEQKALQRIEEILAHLLSKKETNDASAESFSQAQYAIRLTEKITTSSALKEIATTKVVGLSTMREQAMEQRKLMVSRATLVEQEIVATSGLIRTDLRRAVAAARQDAATTPTRAQQTAADQATQSAPTSEEPTKTRPHRCPRGTTGEPTMLPLRGQSWPALADARGNSKTLQFYDPNQAEPMYQQMVGLHQPLTGDQSRMVVDREVLQEATTAMETKNSERQRHSGTPTHQHSLRPL